VLERDDGRVADAVDRAEHERGVAADAVVQPPGAEAIAGDDATPVHALRAVVDDAGVDQVEHGVGDQIGVDAEVAPPVQEAQRLVRIWPTPTCKVLPSSIRLTM
jgi:hypothetical protein